MPYVPLSACFLYFHSAVQRLGGTIVEDVAGENYTDSHINFIEGFKAVVRHTRDPRGRTISPSDDPRARETIMCLQRSFEDIGLGRYTIVWPESHRHA